MMECTHCKTLLKAGLPAQTHPMMLKASQSDRNEPYVCPTCQAKIAQKQPKPDK